MSEPTKVFFCGSGGCSGVVIPHSAQRFADDVMIDFVDDYKEREGDYPDMKLQIDVWQKALEHWYRKNEL